MYFENKCNCLTRVNYEIDDCILITIKMISRNIMCHSLLLTILDINVSLFSKQKHILLLLSY